MSFAAITGWGMAVPARVVTNAELARTVPGVDADWIERRTGILERRYAAEGQATSTFATAAGADALARAGVDARDLDLILVATCTPDRMIPATAPVVQAALGASRAGALDLNAACAGFLSALAMADGLIRAGRAERALVIGAEVLSRFLDREEPRTYVLFGDGAGAAVLEGSDASAGVVSLVMGASGDGAPLLQMPAGGSARPATPETLAARQHLIRMNGPEVYRAAVRIMTSAAQEAMAAAPVAPGDVDLLILHQANQRIIAEVGARVGVPAERVFSNVARYGNTSAASVPIALCEAANGGLLHPGARVVLSAVGAGFAWAAGVAVWTEATRSRQDEEAEMAGARA